MKKFILILLTVFVSFNSHAQNYGNEWIPFAPGNSYSLQQYFKIQIWQEGVYRINKTTLQSAQIPLTGIDPRNFQLFHNGEEVPMTVHNEQYGTIDSTDYIEFYASKNDGSFDASLYVDADAQTHPEYSLFNDTAIYFLTWNSSTSNKRITEYANTNFNSYVADDYCIKKEHRQFASRFGKGNQDGNGLSDPAFEEGEGWASVPFNETTSPFSSQFSTLNVFTGGPQALYKTKIAGANINQHDVELYFNNSLVASNTFFKYVLENYSISVPINGWGSTVPISFEAKPNSNGLPNRIAVPSATLEYPHTFSFAGETGALSIDLKVNPFSPSRLDITNLSVLASGNPYIYVFGNDSTYKVQPTLDGSTYKVMVPNSGIQRSCYFTNSTLIKSTSGTHFTIEAIAKEPVRFGRFLNFETNKGDYLIITHKKLISAANQYSSYRSTTGFNPLIVDIDELYYQFAYGIEKHPLAIKNFNRYIYDNWSPRAKHMFLLGKSIAYDEARSGNAISRLNLVPTFGVPPSDQMLSTQITDTSFRTSISTGRIAANNEQEVLDYLDKVIGHETAPKDAWMKNVLHFGGGISGVEQQWIASFLSGYEAIISDTCFGAQVTNYLKTSSNPIQINQSQQLQDKIDNGVSLMTFFAHASGSSFDISTDVPANYNNKDKYPLIIANSCFVGDIHTNFISASEDFVLIPDKGAIGFIAEPSLGYPNTLAVYTNELYRNIASKNYGGALGESIKNTIDSTLTGNPSIRSVCMLMTLHGDPAVSINSFDKPDLTIEQPDVFFNPTVVTTDIDSFDVGVVVHNIAKATGEQSHVEIIRQYPSGPPDSIVTIAIQPVASMDTIWVTLPVDLARGAGLNTFNVKVDAFNAIDELSELNNEVTSTLLIQSSDINPVFPYEYAIVPNSGITLKATTANANASVKNYIFEVDTNDTFATPFKLSNTISSSGGVVEWTLPFAADSNLVYYWRVGIDSVLFDTINYKWNESSFIHIPGKNGWSQAHYHQFKKDKYTNVIYDKPNRDFDFVTVQSFLKVSNAMNPFVSGAIEYSINSVIQDYGACQATPSMHIAVIDSISLEPWETKDYDFGQTNQYNDSTGIGTCRNRSEKYFIFRANSFSQLLAMRDMLDTVPNGNYVLAWSVFGGTFSVWPSSVDQIFSDMGATQIAGILDYQPYIFYTQKGKPSSTMEVLGDSLNPDINLNVTLGGNWSQGFIKSTTIGPSANWNTIVWDDKIIPQPFADSISLNVFGKPTFGNTAEFYSSVPITTNTISNVDAVIDANDYPLLELEVYLEDDSLKTPAQMDKWQVFYEPVPEAALNPAKHFSINATSFQEGEEIILSMAVENISDLDMDSMLVDFFILNSLNQRIPIISKRYRALPAGDTLHASVAFNTLGYGGINTLWIEANPNNDQPEQYHFNNLAGISFNVQKDVTNPILDVAFDGIKILNGDIVSSSPHIHIDLHDENDFLALNDTNDLRIFLLAPNGTNYQLNFEPSAGIRTDGNKLKWQPAQLPNNSFQMELEPHLSLDGIYTLSVEASDRSGNLSGTKNYEISFEVINKSTITEVLNYPNPFSTSTKFVFTLTGSQIPEYFKIQIITVSGKVVREITQDELGPLHIGRNITQFAWNGKDEFGDQLANGVYLYRVVTSLNGSEIESRQTDANTYFKNGWGKMYLLR
ncbi:MAG: hypothetical protein HKN75_10820 [Bacteroidia bacterium]|nr:hypothetical protein [Bacteroidia bacterium]